MLEFSALLSAVKPRDRTDQYVILAALYHLKAHVDPISTRQITDLLKLHLRNKMPSNVGSSLRSYNSYVEVATKEAPLQWRLTSKGLERIRTLSALSLATAPDFANFETDIAFICALEHPEFSALVNANGGQSNWQDISENRFSHVYRRSTLTTQNGKQLKVVGTVATSMGLTAASIATTQLVLQYRPRIVVMVGIAAGTRSSSKEFGDILVADPSVDYNSGKVALEDGIREFLPDPYPIGLNARLRSILQKYRAPNVTIDAIRKKWGAALPESRNRLHLGPLGASDQVIDDESRIIEIQKNWRKLIGVEMETYGVYRACHEAPEPKPRFVSFKSVCDFAAQKTDSWQDYAAFTAAEFSVEFLKREWDSIWPST